MFVAMIIQGEFIAQLKAIIICVVIITMETVNYFILFSISINFVHHSLFMLHCLNSCRINMDQQH